MISLFISIVAGVFQRSFLIHNAELERWLGIILMIVAGAGAPVAVWLASPVLGQILNYQASIDQAWLNKAREESNRTNAAALANQELQMQLNVQKR